MRCKDDGVVMHVKLAAEHIVQIGFKILFLQNLSTVYKVNGNKL